MSDIVERLRVRARIGDGWTRPDCAEAADEIERLRAERDEHLRLKHMAVEATTRAWAERDRLAADLAQAHRDVLPWIARVGQLIAALDQAEQAMREAGAVYGADAALAALRKEIKA